MNSFTFAAFAPAVSVCGMIASESAMTAAFCAGVSTFGFHAAAAVRACAWSASA